MSFRGQEKAAPGIAALFQHLVGETAGLLQPAIILGRLVQSEQTGSQSGIVFQVGRNLGRSPPVHMQQQTIVRTQFLQ